MPTPKTVLPLLDGFLMGDAISEHHGVRCYPAMHAESGEKYIVKGVSVPESAAKLDAMLLAGAFPDRAAAISYFQGLAEDVAQEAALLKNLSQLEGFVAYENWQIEPSESGESFDVLMLGKYRPTLERHLQRTPMTHLGAVNLGLDLCSALAVCRRSEYLYVDLKPSNIFICDEKEYRIGDLGFVALNSLTYASLPEKYHSPYTPPEIADAFSALNDTMDIYAVGMILYQIYNNGQLPVHTQEPLPAPEYADQEMAAIILKACDPDPAQRWQDPTQMGQALVNYMQSNTVNDEPIVPIAAPVEIVEDVPESPADTGPTTEEILSVVDHALESVGVEIAAEAAETTEEAPDSSEQTADVTADEMLAQADSLIAHAAPEPVVAPGPIEIPMPERIVLTEEKPEQPDEAPAQAEESAPVQEAPETDTRNIRQYEPLYDYGDEEDEENLKRGKGLIIALISFILVVCMFAGGFWYYKNEYQQSIQSISLSGTESSLSVVLLSDVDDSLLSVTCTDAYGNAQRQAVLNGTATFTGLTPNTLYKVEVEISGFHELIGQVRGVYLTSDVTTIGELTAIAGSEDGSVNLSFTVAGSDSPTWQIFYSAEGEAEKSVTISGHAGTISGLTVGKCYTFRVEPTVQLRMNGSNTIEFTASNVICPENLQIVSFLSNAITITWQAPENTTVSSWTVRCYNDSGFDKTITTGNTVAIFENLDRTTPYTIEVCAAGMSVSNRIFLAANSVTVLNFIEDTSDPLALKLNWTFEGIAPADGWVVKCTISGLEDPIYATASEASLVVLNIIPGCTYHFEVMTATGDPIFENTYSYTAPAAETFYQFGIAADQIQFSMCLTPELENWMPEDLNPEDYTNTFTAGQSASFVMQLMHQCEDSTDNLTAMFVIRNADGTIVGFNSQTAAWSSMWVEDFGTMTLPVMPEIPGDYTVEIYFNGQYVTTQTFSIA